jgi:hypothetical protein
MCNMSAGNDMVRPPTGCALPTCTLAHARNMPGDLHPVHMHMPTGVWVQ